jgi:hypothetical protein
MNFNGANPNAPSQPVTVNTAKPTPGVTANGEPKSWGTFLLTILGLPASLAFNIYISLSYMDARQKYQALVRRTADTFRRTKVAA